MSIDESVAQANSPRAMKAEMVAAAGPERLSNVVSPVEVKMKPVITRIATKKNVLFSLLCMVLTHFRVLVGAGLCQPASCGGVRLVLLPKP